MNSKRFEYTHKEIPQLKKDILFRTVFAVLFLVIFVWQFISTVIVVVNSSLTIMQSCSSAMVLILSLFLALICFLYAFKDFRIVAAIKMNGRCVSAVQTLFNTNKNSFIKLYSFIIQIVTLCTTLILVCSATYSILQATILSSVSFYMPLLFMICLSGYNSIYHIKDEIRTQKLVQEYNRY